MMIKLVGPRATRSNFQVLRYSYLHEGDVLVMLRRVRHIHPTYSTLVPVSIEPLSVDHGQPESRSPSQCFICRLDSLHTD